MMMAEPGRVTGTWAPRPAGSTRWHNCTGALLRGMECVGAATGAPLRSARSTSNGAPRKGATGTYDPARPLGVGDGIRVRNLLGGTGVWCETAGCRGPAANMLENRFFLNLSLSNNSAASCEGVSISIISGGSSEIMNCSQVVRVFLTFSPKRQR
jgi:hypothetical protein